MHDSKSQVVEQLRSAGVIAAIQISRAAYPYRTPHRLGTQLVPSVD